MNAMRPDTDAGVTVGAMLEFVGYDGRRLGMYRHRLPLDYAIRARTLGPQPAS